MPVQLLNDFNLKKLLGISSAQSFNDLALELFQFQSENVPIYKSYLNAIGCHTGKVNKLNDIPFLPISFFKTHEVSISPADADLIFESSGTSGSKKSKHHVLDPVLYQLIAKTAFENTYGPLSGYSILGLLPSYLERAHSSLIYMVNEFMNASDQDNNGFFLDDFDRLKSVLMQNKASEIPTILIGVTFALLDFVESHQVTFEDLIVMETGGMKGRRDELTRAEVHAILKKGFGVSQIHSEYGMTEMLSQAYAKSEGMFIPPPWMKVRIRDVDDPFSFERPRKTGGLNIIDLANIHSCAFIATEDLGRMNSERSFEVLGRMDNSDIRGCSLLAV